MNVLLIGSGGREHALAWAISASPLLTKLYCAPGNAGIAEVAECVALDTADHAAVIAFCRDRDIGLVVIGPEVPLVAGLAERLPVVLLDTGLVLEDDHADYAFSAGGRVISAKPWMTPANNLGAQTQIEVVPVCLLEIVEDVLVLRIAVGVLDGGVDPRENAEVGKLALNRADVDGRERVSLLD